MQITWKRKQMRLNELFTIKNGIASTGLNVEPSKQLAHIPFLRPARTQQRTIAGWVWRGHIEEKNIYPPETLFVSTNGEGSHSFAYISSFEFVPNSDVSVLIPKKEMTLHEKIYYARCISKNRYRFSYGRKPKGNRLGAIELPESIPKEFKAIDIDAIRVNANTVKEILTIENSQNIKPITRDRKLVPLKDLFTIQYGNQFDLYQLDSEAGYIDFVSRGEKNNGVSSKVRNYMGVAPFSAGLITVALGGSVLASFVQQHSFYTGQNVKVLSPKREMDLLEKLFYCMIIKHNRFRYTALGREANKTLQDLLIPEKMPEEFKLIDIAKLQSLVTK